MRRINTLICLLAIGHAAIAYAEQPVLAPPVVAAPPVIASPPGGAVWAPSPWGVGPWAAPYGYTSVQGYVGLYGYFTGYGGYGSAYFNGYAPPGYTFGMKWYANYPHDVFVGQTTGASGWGVCPVPAQIGSSPCCKASPARRASGQRHLK